MTFDAANMAPPPPSVPTNIASPTFGNVDFNDDSSYCLAILQQTASRLEELETRLHETAAIVAPFIESQDPMTAEVSNENDDLASLETQSQASFLLEEDTITPTQEDNPQDPIGDTRIHINNLVIQIEDHASRIATYFYKNRPSDDDPKLAKALITCKKKIASAYKRGKQIYKKYSSEQYPTDPNQPHLPPYKASPRI